MHCVKPLRCGAPFLIATWIKLGNKGGKGRSHANIGGKSTLSTGNKYIGLKAEEVWSDYSKNNKKSGKHVWNRMREGRVV